MDSRRGMTLTELLIAAASMAGLLAAFAPALVTVKDAANRTVCAANLSNLGKALAFYAADHNGLLPDCGAASTLGGQVPRDGRHYPSRANAPGTCAWPHVRSVGNQANLWLLVRQDYASARAFVCPATPDRPSVNSDRSPAVMGFLNIDPATGRAVPGEDQFLRRVAAGRCSYSYQNQFAHPDTDPDLVGMEAATTHQPFHSPRLPVLADRNPYTRTDLVRQPIVSPDEQPEANSLNHNGVGQNVLYLGGDVQWQETPRCGEVRADGRRDNIYWPDAGRPDDPLNLPRDPADSFLVP